MKKFKLFSIPLALGVLSAALLFTSCKTEPESTLPAPTDLTATVTGTSIVVNWNAVDGAASYEVQRSFDGTESNYNATQNSYTDASPGEGANSYVVRAVASDGTKSEWSASASCTYAAPLLPAPANVTAVQSANTIVVNWDAVEGADKYEVKRTFGETDDTYEATENSYTDESPGDGSNAYVVRAVDADGTAGEWSSATSCTYEAGLPAPKNAAATQNQNTVIVTWDAVAGATGYRVHKANLTTYQYEFLEAVTETTFTDEDPDNDINYYKITATNGTDESGLSNAASLNFSSVKFRYKDVLDAYKAFNDYMYNPSIKMYRRESGNNNSWAVNWTQSMYFDMIMNAYRLTKDKSHLQRMADMYLDGCYNYCRFDWYNSTDSRWRWDLYDDPMWWVGTLARAYLFLKEFPEAAEYGLVADDVLAVAVAGFDRVWYGSTTTTGTTYPELDAYGSYSGDDPATVYYKNSSGQDRSNGTDNHKGGMFWDWKFQRKGKMACITFPTTIAAMYLHKALPNATDAEFASKVGGTGSYLDKAKDLYQWATASLSGGGHLYRTSDGAVADSKHIGNTTSNFSTTVYNQATCMGAGCLLYLATNDAKYLTVAKKAMDYIVNNKLSSSSTIWVGDGEEFGVHNAILAQYLPLLIADCGQEQYLSPIETSIELGWKNRSTTRLCGKNFTAAGPTAGTVYNTVGIPAYMLTFPGVKDRH